MISVNCCPWLLQEQLMSVPLWQTAVERQILSSRILLFREASSYCKWRCVHYQLLLVPVGKIGKAFLSLLVFTILCWYDFYWVDSSWQCVGVEFTGWLAKWSLSVQWCCVCQCCGLFVTALCGDSTGVLPLCIFNMAAV